MQPDAYQGEELAPRLSPEVPEPIRRQLGIAHRVLDIAMPEPRLQRSRVVACVRQCVAAGMSQHVWMNRKWHFRPLAQARNQGVKAFTTRVFVGPVFPFVRTPGGVWSQLLEPAAN